MQWILGLVVAIIALGLAIPSAGQARRPLVYVCAEGRVATVTYGSGWVEMVFGGRSSRLNVVPSGSGNRYSDGRWEWRTNGPMGMLAKDGRVVARDCLPLAGGTAAATIVNYVCTNGMRIRAAYHGNAAVVTMWGRRYTMYQTMAASGVRYAGGELVWWTKGPHAFLTTSGGGMIARSCQAK